MERGQVTIEMIFIFGLFMLLIFAVSVPSVMQAGKDAKDVQYVSDAKFATDRLATYASDILNPYERKNVEIYIPGYLSDFDSAPPLYFKGTCIETDGRYLNTSLIIVNWDSECRTTRDEDYYFSKDLGVGDWKMYVRNGSVYQEGVLFEAGPMVGGTGGQRYNLTISWKNITSHTEPTYFATTCDGIQPVLEPIIIDALVAGGCTPP